MLQPKDFFDTSDELVYQLFDGYQFAWDALKNISQHVSELVGNSQTILGKVSASAYLSDKPIFVGENALVEAGVLIEGPAYIGAGTIIRHGAYIRENVILLPGSLLGHASEAKNSIFLPNSHAPHFNYVGDSILGNRVNLGAGTKLSNLTILSEKDINTGVRPSLKINIEGTKHDTGLAKFGAILGDDVQTGCNAVLNPGCLVGQDTLVYANVSLRKGYYPPNQIIKLRQEIIQVDRK